MPFVKTPPVSTAHINADNFNRECFCISLDEQALRRSMAAEVRLSIGCAPAWY